MEKIRKKFRNQKKKREKKEEKKKKILLKRKGCIDKTEKKRTEEKREEMKRRKLKRSVLKTGKIEKKRKTCKKSFSFYEKSKNSKQHLKICINIFF